MRTKVLLYWHSKFWQSLLPIGFHISGECCLFSCCLHRSRGCFLRCVKISCIFLALVHSRICLRYDQTHENSMYDRTSVCFGTSTQRNDQSGNECCSSEFFT